MATDTLTLTPEQTAAIAKGLGLEPKDLAPEKLLAAIETATKTAIDAAVAKVKPAADLEKQLADAQAKIKSLEKPGDNDSEAAKLAAELRAELKTLAARAEAGEKAAQDLRVMARDTLIEGAIRGGKLEPALRKQFEALYDEAPELTRKTIDEMPKRDDLFKTYGADGADISGAAPTDEPDEEQKKADDMYRQYCESVGIEAPATRTAVAA